MWKWTLNIMHIIQHATQCLLVKIYVCMAVYTFKIMFKIRGIKFKSHLLYKCNFKIYYRGDALRVDPLCFDLLSVQKEILSKETVIWYIYDHHGE